MSHSRVLVLEKAPGGWMEKLFTLFLPRAEGSVGLWAALPKMPCCFHSQILPVRASKATTENAPVCYWVTLGPKKSSFYKGKINAAGGCHMYFSWEWYKIEQNRFYVLSSGCLNHFHIWENDENHLIFFQWWAFHFIFIWLAASDSSQTEMFSSNETCLHVICLPAKLCLSCVHI